MFFLSRVQLRPKILDLSFALFIEKLIHVLLLSKLFDLSLELAKLIPVPEKGFMVEY